MSLGFIGSPIEWLQPNSPCKYFETEGNFLNDLCGEAIVIETESTSEILLCEIPFDNIRQNDIVFFKTRNSQIHKNIYV